MPNEFQESSHLQGQAVNYVGTKTQTRRARTIEGIINVKMRSSE